MSDPRRGPARDPFASAPGAAMFHRASGTGDALARLHRAVRGEGALSLVVGRGGDGKSSIARALADELRRDGAFTVGAIGDPRGCRTDLQFLRAILAEFAVETRGRSALTLSGAFAAFLLGQRDAGRRAVLLIDEAHRCSGAQLEILRTLLGADAAERAFHLVLFAEPEVRERIARKRNLAQRIVLDHRLIPLTRRDTGALIAHRIAAADWPDASPPLFSEDAIDRIHRHAQGSPGAVVQLCASAHDGSLPGDGRRIDASDVERALRGKAGAASDAEVASVAAHAGSAGGAVQIPLFDGGLFIADVAAANAGSVAK